MTAAFAPLAAAMAPGKSSLLPTSVPSVRSTTLCWAEPENSPAAVPMASYRAVPGCVWWSPRKASNTAEWSDVIGATTRTRSEKVMSPTRNPEGSEFTSCSPAATAWDKAVPATLWDVSSARTTSTSRPDSMSRRTERISAGWPLSVMLKSPGVTEP